MQKEMTQCAICGNPTPKLMGVSSDDTICYKCQQDIIKGVRKEKDDEEINRN